MLLVRDRFFGMICIGKNSFLVILLFKEIEGRFFLVYLYVYLYFFFLVVELDFYVLFLWFEK